MIDGLPNAFDGREGLEKLRVSTPLEGLQKGDPRLDHVDRLVELPPAHVTRFGWFAGTF